MTADLGPRTEDSRGKCLRKTLLIVSLLAAGCRQEMYDQPKYKPLGQSNFYSDRRASRPLPEGTVARGWLRADPRLSEGKEGRALATALPMPLSRDLLLRGRERYNIFCAPCHNRTGGGRGMVVRRGYQPPPSLHIERLRDAPVGYFYDVVTNGLGAMPDYASQVPVEDRWAIAAYIKALQLSQYAPVSDVPSPLRASLPDSPPRVVPTPAVIRELGQGSRNKPVVR